MADQKVRIEQNPNIEVIAMEGRIALRFQQGTVFVFTPELAREFLTEVQQMVQISEMLTVQPAASRLIQ